jgi:hypothetical protein
MGIRLRNSGPLELLLYQPSDNGESGFMANNIAFGTGLSLRRSFCVGVHFPKNAGLEASRNCVALLLALLSLLAALRIDDNDETIETMRAGQEMR